MLVSFPLLATDLDCSTNPKEPAQRHRTKQKHEKEISLDLRPTKHFRLCPHTGRGRAGFR